MLSYLDYLMFLNAVFCTEQLYGFRGIIFSLFLRKKKLKITCQFCMGFRLTKMEDLQNALISRLFLHAVFCTEQLYGFRRMIFSIFYQRKKLKTICPFCKGYRLTKMEDFQKCSHTSSIWCFCTRSLAQNNSMASVESYSALFRQKKVENKGAFTRQSFWARHS